MTLRGTKRAGTGLLRVLGDLLRVTAIGAFPFGTVAVLALVLSVPQGQDVLRILLEKAADASITDLICLAVTALLHGLSVWYSLKWLLKVDFPGLDLQLAPDHWIRCWLPRLLGAAVPAAIAVGLYGAQTDTSFSGWLWISGFAVLALGLLGFLRLRQPLLKKLGWPQGPEVPGVTLPPTTWHVMSWAIALSFVAAMIFVVFPINAPRILGAAALLPLSLACINLFGSLLLTWLPLKNSLPPLAPAALAWAFLCALVNDNHAVLTFGSLPALPLEDARPSLQQQFQRWSAPQQTQAPYVVVATEGGGIRAAYWTAAVLEQLSLRIPGFERQVFALSGVSGGSLGAAAWVTAFEASGPACRGTRALRGDYLAPAVAGMLFGDFIQRFVPLPLRMLDRSRGIEGSWQQAFGSCSGQRMARPLRDIYAQAGSALPALFLNTTIVETGQRAIQSPVRVRFDDAVDLQDPKYSSAYQTLAGVAHNSARFPLVSPAGTVLEAENGRWKPRYRVVDGGYFDNSGVTTALDVVRALRSDADIARRRAILLIVRNDAAADDLCEQTGCLRVQKAEGGNVVARDTAGRPVEQIRPSPVLPETTSILLGLYNARGAHARLAALTALREMPQLQPPQPAADGAPAAVYELAFDMPGPRAGSGEPAVEPPLGWVLSEASQRTMRDAAIELVERQGPALAASLQRSFVEVAP